ncbi:MAG TPA: PAS domain S-box protein, partial [Rhodocyclaceae bacterium]|nr:PAS domain S-box protein [Rhodocyclaceae bacterium]
DVMPLSAEEALSRSQEKYRHVIENVLEGITVLQKGAFAFINPKGCDILQHSEEELIGRPFVELLHPDDRALVADRHARRIRGEEVEASYDVRVITGQGETRWVELGVVLLIWDGEPATLCFFSDISARKALEASLKQSLIDREIVLDNSIVGIAFVGADGKVHLGNRAMCEMFGVNHAEHVRLNEEYQYGSREDFLRVKAMMAKGNINGQGFAAEVQMRRRDNGLIWVSLFGKAVRPDDPSKGTVWSLLDITRRKELEFALQKTSSEREIILESALVGISFMVNGQNQWVNKTFAAMFGYAPEELIGKSTRLHFPSDESWNNLAKLSDPVLQRGEQFSIEWEAMRKDGTIFWVQCYANCVVPNDPSRGSIWSLLDITERRQAEDETRMALAKQKELNLLKSRFVSMTSHEFRTPLAAILSSAELLRHYSDRMPPEEKEELFESIEASIGRMTQMLDNILIIGRADADHLDFKPMPVRIGDLVEALVSEVRSAVVADGRETPEFVVSVEADTEILWLDEKLVRHILGNLLSNAFKYSPSGGVVRFDTRMEEGNLAFTVTDQGIGIPEDELHRLFESFHRANNVGNIPGTGLGLAIVKKAVDAHCGTIAVTSKVGEGTCFRVSLPAQAGDLNG